MTLYMYITNQHDNNERNQDIFTLIMKHKKNENDKLYILR